MSGTTPPTQEDFYCVINYLQWKRKQLSALSSGGKLDPLLCVELQTGVSLMSSLVYEDLEYLLIKGQLYG